MLKVALLMKGTEMGDVSLMTQLPEDKNSSSFFAKFCPFKNYFINLFLINRSKSIFREVSVQVTAVISKLEMLPGSVVTCRHRW